MCLTSIRIDHKRQRPGWPAEVPLPVDPLWKSQYAARIDRLVRAGVDPPLANLFVHVAKPPDLKAEGAEHARSSTVQLRRSFIAGWKRCQRLPVVSGSMQNCRFLSTAGRRMEVDLLSAESQIAIELDGGQHLAVAEAYHVIGARMFCSRLIQGSRGEGGSGFSRENGYHVLRFLCEDVGKRLDEVLDAIVRALSHRCTRRITEKGRS